MLAASSETFEYRFICPLPNGIHARPATCLEQVVSRFKSQVSIVNLNNRNTANMRSVLSMVGADIKAGDECVLKISGEDSAAAYQEITRFLEHEFAACDDAIPHIAEPSKEVYIPPVLRAAGVPILSANPVVSGFGRGHLVFLDSKELPADIVEPETTDIQQELRKIDNAVAALQSELSLKLKAGNLSGMESEILKAHLSFACDVELLDKIYNIIKEQYVSAGKAIIQALEHYSAVLKLAQSRLIQERVADLKDICSQLFYKIYNSSIQGQITLTRPSVCITDNLTPSEFIAMDKSYLSGLVLRDGATTSHTVILARSFGIPTLTGLEDTGRLLKDGQEVIVDANYGLLIGRMNDRIERFYALEQQNKDVQQQRLSAFKDKPARTRDGATIEIMANVSLAQEVQAAMSGGAEGIGLYRTEMLFMGRDAAPGEQEQFEEYKKAAIYAAGKPVIIRTFDLGGDKAVPYLNLAREENPFLGYRGVRLYKQYEDLFIHQLRAILKASAFGNLKILIPMVTCVEEVIYVRQLLEHVKALLDSESVPFNKDIPLGIMVEIPSVAFIIPQLAKHVDFLSIGTNDLIQYLLAVDRGNKQVNALYHTRHPAVLALIKQIIDSAHAHHVWVGICGEMAGQTDNLPFLLGFGVDELSMSIPHVTKVKARCGQYDTQDCRRMLEQAIESETVEQVNSIFTKQSTEVTGKSVIDVQLVDLHADCINKEEVIKYISDMLCTHQRTDNPLELEKDFWHRETIYSTGLGFGFAIPHCKTSHIHANSICFIRLKQPLTWGSIDDKPVDTVVGMTIRDTDQAANTHMKIFSTLARSIMHEDFRQRLRDIQDKAEIAAYLHEKLELDK